MGEQIIQFETAKIAKKKGYSIPTNIYNSHGEYMDYINPMYNHEKNYIHHSIFYAPTQSLLARWLRENHNIHVVVYPIEAFRTNKQVSQNKDDVEYFYTLYKDVIKDYRGGSPFDNYEDAFEKGLQAGLELISDKK